MRITNNVMIGNMMKNLQKNMEGLDRYNQQLSSGKKFQYPSQNPIGTAESIKLGEQLAANEQYIRNLEQSNDWLNKTESALANAGKLLQRARELAVYGASDTLDETDRQTIAKEVEQLKDELVNVANTRLGDRYLFAGEKTKMTSSEPFSGTDPDVGGIKYNGNKQDIEREIAPGTTMVINTDSKGIFKDAIDKLDAMEKLLNDNNGEVGNIDLDSFGDAIKEVDSSLDDFMQKRAEVGSRINRLDLVRNRLEDEKIHTEELLSKNEDIDIAKVITDFKMQESVYRASLSVGARTIQPTLVDFLR